MWGIRLLQRTILCNAWDLAIATPKDNHSFENEEWDFHLINNPYHTTRWFADPFILSVSEDEVILLAEEFSFRTRKGRIARLTIDLQRFTITDYSIILELDSHLSFPVLLRHEGNIFVCPENSTRGTLDCYRYDDSLQCATKVGVLLNIPATDAIIESINDHFFIITTRLPNQNGRELVVYSSEDNNLLGQYKEKQTFKLKDNTARNAGSVFTFGNELIRPAQICNNRYGEGLSFQRITEKEGSLSFQEISTKYPPSKYSGMHTYNTLDGYTVIDYHRKRYPIFHKVITSIFNLIRQ